MLCLWSGLDCTRLEGNFKTFSRKASPWVHLEAFTGKGCGMLSIRLRYFPGEQSSVVTQRPRAAACRARCLSGKGGGRAFLQFPCSLRNGGNLSQTDVEISVLAPFRSAVCWPGVGLGSSARSWCGGESCLESFSFPSTLP